VNLLEEGGNDTVHVQPWIPYSKYSIMSLRLIVDTVQYMVQPWVFHDEFLLRNAFDQIEVLMDDGFNPIVLVSNSIKSQHVMLEIFLASKESLFGVYFKSDLVPINKYEFGPHGIQSWLGLIKMLGSYHICLGLIFLFYNDLNQQNIILKLKEISLKMMKNCFVFAKYSPK
jgi:hypothetical protein